MNSKRFTLLLVIFLIFVSVLGAYASDAQQSIYDIDTILLNNNPEDMEGCCSVVCQLDGNNSIISFRRDASYSAEIHIEQVDWHGKQAIKQYKTDGKYFCQVIVTEDGWVMGFGGLDDGEDNEKVENITAKMVCNESKISEGGLNEIQAIKQKYGLGHAVIKSPDGKYGATTATNVFTGTLKPGDYISLPNRYSFYRSGNIGLNDSDKIKTMTELAKTDMFGLTRRDITIFDFHAVDNSSFKGNVTDVYLSNDDGAVYDMHTEALTDDVDFNGTQYNGSSLPIAPKYKYVGTFEFEEPNTFGFFDLAVICITVILLGILVYVAMQYVQLIIRGKKR